MKPTILITISGGVVTSIFANVESDIIIVDYDNMQEGEGIYGCIATYENDSLGVFLASNPEIDNHIKSLQ